MSASGSTSRSSTTSTEHLRMRSQSAILPRISEPSYSPLGDHKNPRERLMHYPWKKIALGAGLFVALLWLFSPGSSSSTPETGAFTFQFYSKHIFHLFSWLCPPMLTRRRLHSGAASSRRHGGQQQTTISRLYYMARQATPSGSTSLRR